MIDKAYAIALIMLLAPASIATEQGQDFLENFDKTPDNLVTEQPENDRTEMLDDIVDEEILNDRVVTDNSEAVEDCYTLEQWKERLNHENWDEKDWDRENWNEKDWEHDRYEDDEEEDREESDRARGGDEKKKTDKSTDNVWSKTTDEDCFTAEEFEQFFANMHKDVKNVKGYEKDCVTIEQVREKWAEAREIDYENDRDDQEKHNHEDDVADDHSHDDNVADDHDHVEPIKDDSRCINKKMLHEMDKKFGRDRGQKAHERERHDEEICIREDENGVIHYGCEEDGEMAEIRAMMAELGEACEAGNEEACEELEEWTQELENDEREGKEECDRENDESDEEEDEENWDDEDDSEDEEDDSEDDDPENA